MEELTDPSERSGEIGEQAVKIKKAASEAMDEARQTAKSAWEKVTNKINDMESLKAYFKDNPVRAAAVIFGVGFLTGLLCRK